MTHPVTSDIEAPEAAARAPEFPDLDHEFFAGIVDACPDPYVIVDLAGNIRWASSEADNLLGPGHGSDEYLGRNLVEFLAPDSVEAALHAFGQYTRSDRPDTGWVGPPIPLNLELPGDRVVPAEVRLVPTADPSFPGAVIVLQVNAPETALYTTIERVIADAPIDSVMSSILRLIELESPYSVPAIGWGWNGERFTAAVASADAPCIDGNPLPTGLAGATPWELRFAGHVDVTDDHLDAIDPDLRAVAERNGIVACWVFPIGCNTDPGDAAVVVIWRRTPGHALLNLARRVDRITGLVELAFQSHQSRQLLRNAARTDAVTGLFNRRALSERLSDLDHPVHGAVIGVMYCDLDHFKSVNDDHGHPVGDRVLTVAAERLRSRIRAEDFIARVGGDEFVVVASAESEAEIETLANRLVTAFDDTVSVGDVTVRLGISVGWACAPGSELGHDVTADDLLARADEALLRAKATGKARVVRA